MFKRPLPRVEPDPTRDAVDYGPVVVDSFLHKLLNPKPTEYFVFHKRPIYREESYRKLLRANNKSIGIPHVEPILPKADEIVCKQPDIEPELLYSDRVQVTLRILKNGIVRIKINSAIASLYKKYNYKISDAPLKAILQAYKSHGFSEKFLNKVKRSHQRNIDYFNKADKIISKIFEKEPSKKVKREKKKKPVEDIEESEIVEDPPPVVEEAEEEAGEIGMDVEPDGEDDEVVEEEYVSDGDD